MTPWEVYGLLAACGLQWLAVGLLLWRIDRLEKRFHAFTTDVNVHDYIMENLDTSREIDRYNTATAAGAKRYSDSLYKLQ
jgi:hypothetical protein